MVSLVDSHSLLKTRSSFKDWDYEVHASARRSAKIAWILFGVMAVIACLAVGAVFALIPLKTIEPVFVRVDQSTGIVDILQHLDDTHISKEDALDKAFLAKYVRLRESYFYPLFERQHQQLLRMSDRQARDSYLTAVSTDNPDSPIHRYEDEIRVTLEIKTIAFIGDGIASVRFVSTVHRGLKTSTHHYIATLVYDYVKDASLPLSVLLENPLAFVVTDYRVDPETIQ